MITERLRSMEDSDQWLIAVPERLRARGAAHRGSPLRAVPIFALRSATMACGRGLEGLGVGRALAAMPVWEVLM